MTLSALFHQHVALRQKTTEQALRDCRVTGWSSVPAASLITPKTT